MKYEQSTKTTKLQQQNIIMSLEVPFYCLIAHKCDVVNMMIENCEFVCCLCVV